MNTTLDFIHDLDWHDVPIHVQNEARRALLDLLGVAAAGTQTRLSRIIRSHVLSQFGSGERGGARLLFDGRRVSATGAALAGGMLIDSVDAHDGHRLTKGHVGCGVLPALLAMCDYVSETPPTSNNDSPLKRQAAKARTRQWSGKISETDLLCALVVGYEVGTRAGIALHRTATDYHTSGAWISLAAAALSARLLHLNAEQTLEAIGIAEYHGPRSQMMRCIDHPTMVKDGSGWGAMSGVSAALLAQDGFTGAPAITVVSDDVQDLWCDLGDNWRIGEQYTKSFPVCRWAQPAICAALNLRARHDLDADQIEQVRIGTFHESWRLAAREPETTEQAQYSLPFPVAAALVNGTVGVEHIEGDGLNNERVLSLSKRIELVDVPAFNEVFPQRRISEVTLRLKDGTELSSGPTEAAGDPESPMSLEDLEKKFMTLASPVLGSARAMKLSTIVAELGNRSTLAALDKQIYTSGVLA